MGKAILFLVLAGLAVIGFVVYRSYTRATGKDPLTATAQEGKSDAAKKEQKSGDIFSRANEIANETVTKGSAEVKDALKTKLNLTVEPSPIEVAPGKSVEAKITRGTADLPALNLKLDTPKDAGLKVTGGAFAAGQKQTTISVEAPAGAKSMDTMVTLRFEDYALPVPVRIK